MTKSAIHFLFSLCTISLSQLSLSEVTQKMSSWLYPIASYTYWRFLKPACSIYLKQKSYTPPPPSPQVWSNRCDCGQTVVPVLGNNWDILRTSEFFHLSNASLFSPLPNFYNEDSGRNSCPYVFAWDIYPISSKNFENCSQWACTSLHNAAKNTLLGWKMH